MNPPSSHTALLVIDVQQGLFKKSTPVYKASELIEKIYRLAERAHLAGVPVIYVQHNDQTALKKDSPEWHLHTGLKPLADDCHIFKQHGNSFEETNLGEILRAKNVTDLVITGMVTHGCVRATTIGALECGYNVTLVQDGHSSYSKDAADLIEK
jgi:nicotinamidase-related amidase